MERGDQKQPSFALHMLVLRFMLIPLWRAYGWHIMRFNQRVSSTTYKPDEHKLGIEAVPPDISVRPRPINSCPGP
jgi:hypothetical protein